jgi:hypothetical protein
MKKIALHITAALLLAGVLASCDKDFEEMNRNPNAYVDPDVNQIFTYTIVRANGDEFENHRANLIYSGNMIQHFASFSYTGDKYTYSAEWSGAFFDRMFVDPIKELTQLLSLIPDDAENINKRGAVRVMRVYVFHRVTDLYGDVPYFEAGQGFLSDITKPKYDRQSEIYADMLKELDESARGFTTGAPTFGQADLLFNGDPDKWRKFANSLMLRLAMRLTKVDAAKAEEFAKKAIAGGVFELSDGIGAVLQHSDESQFERNPNSIPLIAQDLQGGNNPNNKLSKTFIDYLKSNNDPRLRIIAKLEATGDNNPANQKGLPNGSDASTIPPGTPITSYSNVNTSTILRHDAPSFFLTTAEVRFLLAEAAIRGWYNGDPATLYREGIRASMNTFNAYTALPSSNVAPVSDAELNAYLAAHPFNAGGTFEQKMEQIHTQMWVALFMNEIEAYANWRRTGYPVLIPVNYPGNVTGGTIPRRLRYNENEISANADNYRAALAQQGPDEFTTRIWWDKP